LEITEIETMEMSLNMESGNCQFEIDCKFANGDTFCNLDED
jgi:hypothetical protein